MEEISIPKKHIQCSLRSALLLTELSTTLQAINNPEAVGKLEILEETKKIGRKWKSLGGIIRSRKHISKHIQQQLCFAIAFGSV